MSKKIQLSIATPCHENWDNMNPVEKGKFCGSCQKQVVDFSNMSDRQVAEFFKKPSTGSVCGRFMQDQLDRDIVIPKKRIPWLKYFFQFMLPAFLVSVKASAQTKGRVRVPTATTDTARIPVASEYRTMGIVAPGVIKPFVKDTVTPIKKPAIVMMKADVAVNTLPAKPDTNAVLVCNREIMGKVSMPLREIKVDTVIVRGRIIDEKGEGLPGVSIIIKGTHQGVITNNKGEFSIKPHEGWEIITLTASTVGFETKEALIEKKNYSGPVTISVIGLHRILMGEVVMEPVIKKDTKPVPLIPDLAIGNTTRFFTVYPNPVITGTSLTIEWKQTEEGYYILQLADQSGRSVHSEKIWIDAEARLLNINIPAVAAGSYYLRMTNKNTGKYYTEKVVIQ